MGRKSPWGINSWLGFKLWTKLCGWLKPRPTSDNPIPVPNTNSNLQTPHDEVYTIIKICKGLVHMGLQVLCLMYDMDAHAATLFRGQGWTCIDSWVEQKARLDS